MNLDALRRRALNLAHRPVGRLVVAAAALAVLASSIPNLHVHAHDGGHALHEHSAFDAPEVALQEHGDDNDDDDRDDRDLDHSANTLHVHDGNHPITAVGGLLATTLEIVAGTCFVPAFSAESPPHAVSVPLYRPPIA
jgi:hypothetical protein